MPAPMMRVRQLAGMACSPPFVASDMPLIYQMHVRGVNLGPAAPRAWLVCGKSLPSLKIFWPGPDGAAMDPTPEPGAPSPEPSATGFGAHFDPFSAPAGAAAPDASPIRAAPADAAAPAASPIRTTSVAPPGWTPSQVPPAVIAGGGAVATPAGAFGGAAGMPGPAFGALARSTPADAAIRWRLRAARIDNLIV